MLDYEVKVMLAWQRAKVAVKKESRISLQMKTEIRI